jgi:alkenylglycerophosphocholine/alkenylglycerophosphoethanolamine hydrolase
LKGKSKMSTAKTQTQEMPGDEMADNQTKQIRPTQTFVQPEKLSFSSLHACNVLYECFVLFLCSKREDSTEEEGGLNGFYCGDSFTIGSGAILSFIALITGEAHASLLALQALTWYHFATLALHVRRMIMYEDSSSFFRGKWITLVTVANMALFLSPLFVLFHQKLLKLDVFVGILASTWFLLTYSSPLSGHFGRTIIKALPVMLMALRVFRSPKSDTFSKTIAVGLFICAIADTTLEYSFVAGLAVFLIGHLCFLFAFITIDSGLGLTKAVPMFAYGSAMYMILFPGLQELKAPVGLYVITISSMLWRASLLVHKGDWGMNIALGALSFALSDSLIALDKFIEPIENCRYPILGLYWLGQALIARGAIMRTKSPKTSKQGPQTTQAVVEQPFEQDKDKDS